MNRSLLVVLALAALACSGEPTAVKVTIPQVPKLEAIKIIQGDGQTAQVHSQLPITIGAQVLDSASGAPIVGVVISWAVRSGGGSVFAASGLTDKQGMAYQQWTLGDTAGIQILEARYEDSTGAPQTPAAVKAVALPGPITYAGFASASLWLTGGRVDTVAVSARDAFGNQVPAPELAVADSTVLGRLGTAWQAVGLGNTALTIAAGKDEDTLPVHVMPPQGVASGALRGQLTFVRVDSASFITCAGRWASSDHSIWALYSLTDSLGTHAQALAYEVSNPTWSAGYRNVMVYVQDDAGTCTWATQGDGWSFQLLGNPANAVTVAP